MQKIRIGHELHSLNNLVNRYFDFASHKKEIDTITGNNCWIISYLAKNADKDIYQKDLENQFTITRSTASKVLRLMEQKNLIQRQPVAQDARLKKILLTEKALKISGLMYEDLENMERLLMDGFTEEETQLLNLYIQRMKNNLLKIKPMD